MAGRKVLAGVVVVSCWSWAPVGAEAGVSVSACGGFPAPFAGGHGTSASPYEIEDATNLASITGGYLGCEFRQTADFTLSGEWTPIGSSGQTFRGSYDGNDKTISGLTITGTNDFQGLFGAIDEAGISSLTLSGVSVSGGMNVGALAGNAEASMITRVTVSGVVSGDAKVGGIVGALVSGEVMGGTDDAYIRRSIIANSATSVAVSGITEDVGGVVGYANDSDVQVIDMTGSVSGTGFAVGGLVGSAMNGTDVRLSRVTGAVSGGTSVGGLIGLTADSQLSDSYATGAVNADVDFAGGAVGVVGFDMNDSVETDLLETRDAVPDVSRVYARGVVTAGSAAGGLLGGLSANRVVTGSYWNSDDNDTLPGIGSFEPPDVDIAGSSLTALRNIDTYATWAIIDGWEEFSPPGNVWGICDGVDTPYLLWEETESPCAGGWTVTGFFAPVDMDVINRAVAGKVVPLKWRILDADGDPYGDPQSFVKVQSSSLGCTPALLTVGDDVERYVANSGLRYLGDGYWQFNWKTPTRYAGQCYTVTLTLKGGYTISANFHFRR